MAEPHPRRSLSVKLVRQRVRKRALGASRGLGAMAGNPSALIWPLVSAEQRWASFTKTAGSIKG